jgi:hypothetical protein
MTTSNGSVIKRYARYALFVATGAIAAGYSGALISSPAPVWAPWLLALGIPAAIGAILVLGAARGRGGVGALAIPFAFVIVTLAVGFGLALYLPANENPGSTLWLGLPLRAAIVIYGIGLLPAVVLPIAYALTFETQTLDAADVERVREMAAQKK